MQYNTCECDCENKDCFGCCECCIGPTGPRGPHAPHFYAKHKNTLLLKDFSLHKRERKPLNHIKTLVKA